MLIVEKNLADYVKKKEINLSAMSRATGISYQALYDSLANKNRSRALMADEAVLICRYLDKNPMDFMPQNGA